MTAKIHLSPSQKSAIYNIRNGNYFRITYDVLTGPIGLSKKDIDRFFVLGILTRTGWEIQHPAYYSLTELGKTISID